MSIPNSMAPTAELRLVVTKEIDRIAVSIAEAVQMTGLSRTFLYSEIAANRLVSYKKGARRLINVDALRSYLGARR